MGDKKLTLEELKKVRDQLIQDLRDLQHEEKIVVASFSNPDQEHLIKNLQNYSKVPKHSRELLKAQQNKLPKQEINEEKLINFYKTFTGITINNTSFKTVPLSEDPVDKCCYSYEIDATIEYIQFNITYCSNKPPDDTSQNNEIIKQMKITLAINSFQREIQEGLDFFSQPEHSKYLPNAILFLRTVDKLILIRKNICKELMLAHKDYLEITIGDTSGKLCIICRGVAHPSEFFLFNWQIQWDAATCSARDAFKIEVTFTDQQLLADTKPVFNQICHHSKWSKLTDKQKTVLIKSAVYFLIEADGREINSDSNVTTTQYSNIS